LIEIHGGDTTNKNNLARAAHDNIHSLLDEAIETTVKLHAEHNDLEGPVREGKSPGVARGVLNPALFTRTKIRTCRTARLSASISRCGSGGRRPLSVYQSDGTSYRASSGDR